MSNKPGASLDDGSRSIASVAASSVDGYLRNASRRVRVPTAEGGRGTRRKLAMVTSAKPEAAPETAAPSAEANAVVDADNEWDEVDLPAAPLPAVKYSKEENRVKKAEAHADNADDIKGEGASQPTPSSSIKPPKSEVNPGLTHAPNPPNVKPEMLHVDWTSSQNLTEDADVTSFADGTRPPLIEQPNHRPWQQRDPMYEALAEQRDLLAAQKRSERIQRTSTRIVGLITLLERGRLLWREAHHPRLLRRLLGIHVRPQSPDVPAAKKHRAEASPEAERPESKRFVFVEAVREATAQAAEASDPALRKPSLAPTWVTLKKDSVKNRTSVAVTALLRAVNECFSLQAAEPSPEFTASAQGTAGESTVEPSDAVRQDAESAFQSNWAAPLEPGYLQRKIRERCRTPADRKTPLVHGLYFSIIFLALAALSGLRCRLVVAKQVERQAANGDEDTDNKNNARGADGDGAPLQKMSIFDWKDTKKMEERARNKERRVNGERDEVRSKRLPSCCFWAEVWSPERQSFIAVNPCSGCTTLWGAPYTFSIDGNVIVDATPRYTSKFSLAFMYNRRLGWCRQFKFLWRDQLKWDDNREVSAVLLESFSRNIHPGSREVLARESKQLESLTYAEQIPTTIAALNRNPLFVIDTDLARHEGIYPKNASTTVGTLKGHTVFKSSAVVSMRSRDGWLREGRSVIAEDEEPYKVVPASASNPFAAPSMFFGIWQTKPFEPLPLREDNTIPLHGRTSWYILLDHTPPPGLTHLKQPQIVRVARRMQVDLGLAVVGFVRKQMQENRRGRWETVIDGVVVRSTDAPALVRAYEEWVRLVQEQEAAKRRERAVHWWLLFSQRLLAMQRLQEQYMSGLLRSAMPTR